MASGDLDQQNHHCNNRNRMCALLNQIACRLSSSFLQAGMTRGAQDNGAEVQYCMAGAHTVMSALEFPSVTNARVNGDGGLDIGAATLSALLAATVGLGWSKDNLRTADRCYVNGTYPNGTVKWPCGAVNEGEGTSGTFAMQAQQTMLAALSLGPVGLSDQVCRAFCRITAVARRACACTRVVVSAAQKSAAVQKSDAARVRRCAQPESNHGVALTEQPGVVFTFKNGVAGACGSTRASSSPRLNERDGSPLPSLLVRCPFVRSCSRSFRRRPALGAARRPRRRDHVEPHARDGDGRGDGRPAAGPQS